jgi:hypothetical protein
VGSRFGIHAQQRAHLRHRVEQAALEGRREFDPFLLAARKDE